MNAILKRFYPRYTPIVFLCKLCLSTFWCFFFLFFSFVICFSLQTSDIRSYHKQIRRTVNSCNFVFWIQLHGNGRTESKERKKNTFANCVIFALVFCFLFQNTFNSNYQCHDAENHNFCKTFSFSPSAW